MASVAHDVVHERAAEKARVAQPYMNPYLAGIGLGLVLLAAFVLVGRGLGASGAFNSAIACSCNSVLPTPPAKVVQPMACAPPSIMAPAGVRW